MGLLYDTTIQTALGWVSSNVWVTGPGRMFGLNRVEQLQYIIEFCGVKFLGDPEVKGWEICKEDNLHIVYYV